MVGLVGKGKGYSSRVEVGCRLCVRKRSQDCSCVVQSRSTLSLIVSLISSEWNSNHSLSLGCLARSQTDGVVKGGASRCTVCAKVLALVFPHLKMGHGMPRPAVQFARSKRASHKVRSWHSFSQGSTVIIFFYS